MNSAREVFHAGELAAQERVGVRQRIAETGARVMRDFMAAQHQEFFAHLPTLLVGSVDARGKPWASILSGDPGFVEALDETHLAVHAAPGVDDPLLDQLELAAPLGLLGIEPHTRRRNRMNGTVVEVSDRGCVVQVDQSFGNCPKYIQARVPERVFDRIPAGAIERSDGMLAPAAVALIARSDTLFIATASAHARGHAGADGVDVSHRGGRPGFVRVLETAGRTVLVIPDFSGNLLFNTLGNIVANPRAGLLFIDYATGDLLQITGQVAIVWDGPEVRAFAGAQRLLRIAAEKSLWRARALPLRWSEPQQAPQLAATGTWLERSPT